MVNAHDTHADEARDRAQGIGTQLRDKAEIDRCPGAGHRVIMPSRAARGLTASSDLIPGMPNGSLEALPRPWMLPLPVTASVRLVRGPVTVAVPLVGG